VHNKQESNRLQLKKPNWETSTYHCVLTSWGDFTRSQACSRVVYCW